MTGQAWLVMIFNFLYFALYVVRSTTVIYFFKYNLGREDLATLVGFLGIYGIFGTVFAIQPDAIDYSERKKNRSISGTIAAFQGLFVKASMGLASWVIGLYLGMNDYDGAASTQGAAAPRYINRSGRFCPERSFIIFPAAGQSLWLYDLQFPQAAEDPILP